MPITLQELIDDLVPSNTVLIFGAGASIPSGAPNVGSLIELIGGRFGINPGTLSLSEISALAERKRNRRDLITAIREKFSGLRAKGALLNLPLYDWKSLFTTNYDELVEDSYARSGRPLTVFSSNFDFGVHSDSNTCKLFKLHGTITKDTADGNASKLILTNMDYDATHEYREALYIRLCADLSPGTQVIIIGQSLSDSDLRDVVERAISINQKACAGGKICLLLYERDNNRAELLEMRGIKVAFGGLDDFFLALSRKPPTHSVAVGNGSDPLNAFPGLRPVTKNVHEEIDPSKANASAIFNGWPANFADITRGYTFERSIAQAIFQYLQQPDSLSAILLGGSGVGKTTAARQAVLRLRSGGFLAWEHKSEHPLSADGWLTIAKDLQALGQKGVLLIDEAHTQLYELNGLIDALTSEENRALRLILVSTRNHWQHRLKSPNIYSHGMEFSLSQLNETEIDLLLTLVESSQELRALVEPGFAGFSKHEKRRRLIHRCEADMFVCMRNIFASEKFDDIILREFATLNEDHQSIYRLVAAMESSGIQVHRQLVMRFLAIDARNVAGILDSLSDIIKEYDIDTREGVFGWKIRHAVIASIIAKYKFSDIEKIIQLFDRVIDNISPTYDIEIRTLRALCTGETGLLRIPDKHVQNRLLRRMISIAPGERVPRHRLIRNLLDLGEYEKVESEIRIFEHDCGKDGPIARYRLLLLIARAVHTPGLLQEDRIVILDQARDVAEIAAQRYPYNQYVLGAYCEVGIELYKLTRDRAVFDSAVTCLKKLENKSRDPEITKFIDRYLRRMTGSALAMEGAESIHEE